VPFCSILDLFLFMTPKVAMADYDNFEMQKGPLDIMRTDAQPVHSIPKTRDERELARFGKKQQLRVRNHFFLLRPG
jgi:hypothetical protein